jgi:tetratricopeptide (TPR) repeat protein
MVVLESDPTETRRENGNGRHPEAAPSPEHGAPVANGRPARPISQEAYAEQAAALYEEADHLYAERRYAESEATVTTLLALQDRAVGPQHADYALGLSMLGELRFLQGDDRAAETLFRRALAIRNEVLGPDHPDTATTIGCLGGVLWNRGATADAEALLRQALAIRDGALGIRHPDTLRNRKELGRLLRRRGDWAGAYAVVHEAFRGGATSNGDDPARLLAPLLDASARLGAQLVASADRMRSSGVPVPDDDLAGLASWRRQFAGLGAWVRRHAEALGVTDPLPESFDSLHDVADLLDELAEVELVRGDCDEVRGQALGVLDRVLALTHRRDPDFPPWVAWLQRVRSIREAIANAPWSQLPTQTEALATGEHALVQLLTLVEERERLSDRDWAWLHQAVGESLGKPIASAASRALLVVGAPSPRPQSETAPDGGWAAEGLGGGVDRVEPGLRGPSPAGDGTVFLAANLPNPADRPTSIEPPGDGPPPAGAGSVAMADDSAPRATEGDPHLELARDMAVASLLPTMGRHIYLPNETGGDPLPHRLFRVGRAPNVVTPPDPGSPAPGTDPPDVAAADPHRTPPAGRELSDRYLSLRRIVPTVVAGPLPHIQVSPTDE